MWTAPLAVGNPPATVSGAVRTPVTGLAPLASAPMLQELTSGCGALIAGELVGGHVMLEDPVVVDATRALHLRYPVRR